MAVVRILQSQLHNVSGRSASGDLTIRPLSSTVEVFGMNTVLLAANRGGSDSSCISNEPVGVEQELGSNSTSSPASRRQERILFLS